MANFWSKLFSAKAAPVSSPVEASLRDSVTGLYNRKHLLHQLSVFSARCLRNKETMAIILWDIDGFVDFNNTFGQEAGNKFLSKVSDVIRKSIRSYDEAFRSGADEFCALLIPANEKIAKEVTDRVSKAVSKGLFQGNAEYAGRSFSISSGVFFSKGESVVPEAILYEAGQSLYRSRMAKT